MESMLVMAGVSVYDRVLRRYVAYGEVACGGKCRVRGVLITGEGIGPRMVIESAPGYVGIQITELRAEAGLLHLTLLREHREMCEEGNEPFPLEWVEPWRPVAGLPVRNVTMMELLGWLTEVPNE
jgi:hypothetical protein